VRIRGTLVLVGLALAAILYLQYVELPRSDAAKESEERGKKLAALEPDLVRALEVPLREGGSARVVRSAAGEPWQLEAPLSWPADADAVNGIVSALADLAVEHEIEQVPADLAPFGFGDPARTLRVALAEGEPIELRLGGKAPIGSTRYVLREGAPRRLASVSEASLFALEPALLTLRDKEIAQLDPDAIDSLRVRRAGKLVVAAKRKPAATPEVEPDWEIAEPIAERGDAGRIRRLLQDLSFLRATGFRDGAQDDKALGLAAPEAEVELRAGEREEHLAFGRGEGKVFARVQGGAAVFEVPDRILADLPGDLFAYREKQVAALPTDQATRLSLYLPRDSAQFAFEKKESEWVATGSEVSVDSLKLEDVLYAVRDLEATALVEGTPDPAKLGLEPPRVRVELADAAGKTLGWVELGDQTDEGVAARSSSGDRVWRVANDIGRDVPLSLEAWNAHWVKGGADAAAAESPPGAEPLPKAE
jgi:hypothetical protein